MAKYAFNHDAGNLHGGLGIDEKRIDAIIKHANAAYHLEDDVVHSMERLLNEAQPANIVEGIAMGYALGMIKGREIANQNPLVQLFSGLGGE